MNVIGIDEVGRGSWAGPLLVVAARQIGKLPMGLKDSKLLSRKTRERLYSQIKQSCELGEGWVTPTEIDTVGLSSALRLGVKRALYAVRARPADAVIIDGAINYCPASFSQVQAIVKADQSHPIVSAASVYAKVERDRLMNLAAKKYPVYGFERHVGYGTGLHQAMLTKYGPCDLHRMSYKPLKEVS